MFTWKFILSIFIRWGSYHSARLQLCTQSNLAHKCCKTSANLKQINHSLRDGSSIHDRFVIELASTALPHTHIHKPFNTMCKYESNNVQLILNLEQTWIFRTHLGFLSLRAAVVVAFYSVHSLFEKLSVYFYFLFIYFAFAVVVQYSFVSIVFIVFAFVWIGFFFFFFFFKIWPLFTSNITFSHPPEAIIRYE